MKNIIIQEIEKTLTELNYSNKNLDIHITVPKNKNFGDLSTNIAFLLAKNLKKNPLDIASEIKIKLEKIDIFKEISFIDNKRFRNFCLQTRRKQWQ